MKKLISVILLLCLALGVFTACEKAEGATDGTTDAPTAASTDTSAEAETEPYAEPETEAPTAPSDEAPTEPSDGMWDDDPEPVLEAETILSLDPEVMPEDFSFSLTFGVMGSRYYDSATGRACSGTHEDDPDEYTATYNMSDEQMAEIYRMIAEMDISSYPDEYDPINDPDEEIHVVVSPEERTVLTVRAGGIEKSISAKTAYEDEGYDEKSQAFLDVCRYIEKILQESEEWQALPDNKILFC